MKIRAISLHQPWATAVALGSKRIETRSWSTDYRGLLAIHAAKRRVISDLIHDSCCWSWKGALHRHTAASNAVPLYDALPFGAIVAVCRLVDCRRTDDLTLGEIEAPHTPPADVYSDLYCWSERQVGNFALGRFGWRLADIVALPTPVPCVGRQSFFSWEVPPALHEIPAVRDLLGPF